MCECITEVDKALEAQGGNTKIGVSMPYKQINGRMHLALQVNLETVKADSSVRRRPTGVMATYCPFCGKKYPTFEEMEQDAQLTDRYPKREQGVYLRLCGTCGGDMGSQDATAPQSHINSMLGYDEKCNIAIRYSETMPADLPECHCGDEDENDESQEARNEAPL